MVDSKLRDLTADAAPTSDDLLYLLGDPAGTPVDRKTTVGNLAASAPFSGLYKPVAYGQFKQTMLKHSSDLTTTSTSYVDIDGTLLPALSLTLAVGDVVTCTLEIGNENCANAAVICWDWLIDRPTSADTTFRSLMGCDEGWITTTVGFSNQPHGAFIQRTFVATEAGAHTFKPQWRVNGGTGVIEMSGSYNSFMTHRVTNLGPVTA